MLRVMRLSNTRGHSEIDNCMQGLRVRLKTVFEHIKASHLHTIQYRGDVYVFCGYLLSLVLLAVS